MSKGNPNSNYPQAQINKLPDIGKSIGNLDTVLTLPPCKKNDPEGVAERINQMFIFCKDNNRRPTVELLTVFLGVSRKTLWMWVNDENSEAGRLVDRAKELINALLTEMAVNNKTPYSYVIWLQKQIGYKEEVTYHFAPDKEPLPTRENIVQALPDIVPGENNPDDEIFSDDD